MRRLIAAAALAASLSGIHAAHATLVFYYDPESGNVSFDTASTRSGELYSYVLRLNPNGTDIRFRSENHVILRSAASSESGEAPGHLLAEHSFSQPVRGYFTIGNVLPTDIPSSAWTSLFVSDPVQGFLKAGDDRLTTLLDFPDIPGVHSYTDIIGGGEAPTPEFVYGQPDRPFDNRWDLIDPDDLDWATAATLVYDPATGELVLDTARGEEGGHISWFILESDGGFLPDNFTPWVSSPFTAATPDLIGLAADAIEPGRYSAGRILAPGLTLEEVEATLTSARFVSRAGFGGANFSIEEDGLDFAFALAPAVPEPTALVLAVIAAAGIAHRRCI